MRTLTLSSLVLLFGLTAVGQDPSELFDKAPPAIDEALRARVEKFYGAFVSGKFKEAYLLVADDSQDRFFELGKDQYKGCEIIKIRYSDNFTKAAVVSSCKTDWKWHGVVTPTTFPLGSNWKVIDGEWYWHYVRPTQVATPFSPTGFAPIPPETTAPKGAPAVPQDMAATAKGILAGGVSVDKRVVRLHPNQASQDTIHVRNDMPGSVGLQMDRLDMPGLKITVGKTQLQAHEETTILFEWRLDDPAILCLDCAKRTDTNPTVKLHILPTGQIFPIGIILDNHSSAPPAAGPAQK